MDDLTKLLDHLSQKPVYGSDEYRDWIKHGDFVRFLQTLVGLKEIGSSD
jgi:hypothetical protein